jgi:hypothetical protein
MLILSGMIKKALSLEGEGRVRVIYFPLTAFCTALFPSRGRKRMTHEAVLI